MDGEGKTMTDEARIARLTAMARRVWPDEVAERVTPIVHDPGHYAQLRGRRIGMLVAIHGHPRALDALEAALLVLADPEAKTTTRESFGEAVAQAAAKLAQSSPDLDAKLREIVREPPAWVEQLAGEWEREADKIAGVPGVPRGEEPVFRHCAAELRERAKGNA